jgi:RNA polymerase sigma-70 factor (ECF subfamily)
MQSQSSEDAALVERLKARDDAALEVLVARYQTKVFGLALRLTGDRRDAEEILQDVFWQVVRNIHSFRAESALSTWIYRIATNASLTRLRKRRKNADVPLDEALGPPMTEDGRIAQPVVDWTGLPSDELDRKELAQRLEAAINELPPEYRSVFVLRDIEGLSAEQAYDVLHLSLPALKSRLHRARLFLRKQLADYLTGRHAALTPPDMKEL